MDPSLKAPRTPREPKWEKGGYVVALAATAAMVLLRWVTDPWLGQHLLFTPLVGAVAIAVWRGGWRPAALAAVLGALAYGYLFMEPHVSFANLGVDDLVVAGLYLLTCSVVIGFGEGMRIAQRSAAEGQERLHTTLASIGDAVISTDTECRITTMNAVAESLTGWKQEEAAGLPLDAVFRIVNEETRQPVKNPAQKVLQTGLIVGLANHTALIAKDGTELPIDDSAAPIRCKDGEVVGCVLVFRDVTERRRQEAALRRHTEQLRVEREWLRVTVGSIGDAVITTDTEGRITFLNAEAEAATGWTQQEAVGQPLVNVFRIVNEATRYPVESQTTRALWDGAGGGLANPTVLIGKDGTERPIEDRAAPIRDTQGQILGCVITFRDITERRRADLKRIDDVARFESVVNHVIDGIITIDEHGTVETLNPAAMRLFGFRSEEVIGRNVKLLMPEPYLNEHDNYIANYLQTGEAKIIGIGREVTGRRKDGSTFPMELAVSTFKLEQKQFFTGIVRDITERKRAEEALREADRRKNEFLATLAHELRNPLTPIRNAIQILLAKGSPDPDLKWGREVIARQVTHMARLLDDLLDVSRITHNKLELRKELVELAVVVENAVETSRPLIESAAHELTVTLPDQPIYLEGDPVRLAQVLSNLLNNAAKYTEPGGHIRLTCERQGSDVVMSVNDDGMGIDDEMLPHVFDTFSQAPRVLERSQGGLGIGLSLVRCLVELHGGSVQARSDGPGKGSQLIVRIPLVLEPVAQQSSPPTDGELAGREVRRLLIVDDNKDGADTLAMLLEMTGHEVHTAYDGEDALISVEKFRPDVVLLDIGMPKLNGHEVCRRIRDEPWGERMFLIALTGWGQEDDRSRSEEAGFNLHLVKPVDYRKLIKLLASLPMKEDAK